MFKIFKKFKFAITVSFTAKQLWKLFNSVKIKFSKIRETLTDWLDFLLVIRILGNC